MSATETGHHDRAPFESAIKRVEADRAEQAGHVSEECRSRLLHHEAVTSRSYLLLHGFTNCPAQFSRIACALHDSGSNVFVPLVEGHGRQDRSPEHLTTLTPERLASATGSFVETAAALGERLTIVGFSMGGVLAAWAARMRGDVNEAVLIAPAFVPFGYPTFVAGWLPRYIRMTPERFDWWDPVRKADTDASPYTYRRISRRGIGAVFDLGQIAWHADSTREARLDRVALVLNDNDRAISAPAALRAFDEALRPLARSAEVHRIDATRRFPHDLIDPQGRNAAREPEARVELLGFLGVGDRTSQQL